MSSIGGTYQKSLPAGFFTPSGACGKRTPSTACLLLPLPTGRSPSLDEGGMGTGKSKVGRMSAGARRVIGATAKPLYPIDGKAAGFDRRNPKTSLFEGGGPPAAVEGVRGRWKESAAVEGVRSGGRRSPRSPENSALALHMLHMLLMPRMPKAYDVFIQKPSGLLPENVEIIGMFFFIESTYFEIRKRMKFQKNADL